MNLNPSSMPTSEIDDIFSAKGKAKALESLAPLPSVDEKEEKKKKKKTKTKTKKRKDSDKTDEIYRSSQPKPAKKRPAPETVVDPSSKSSTSSKRPKLDVSVKPSHDKRKEDEDRFKDSRGAAPSKFQPFFRILILKTLPSGRKTDDGFNIYKEDELGISNTGGGMSRVCPCDIRDSSDSIDTPSCPFDCNCCMYWLLSVYCTVSTLPRFLNASGSICSFICSEDTLCIHYPSGSSQCHGTTCGSLQRPRLILFRVNLALILKLRYPSGCTRCPHDNRESDGDIILSSSQVSFLVAECILFTFALVQNLVSHIK